MLRKTQHPSQRRYDTHPINTLCWLASFISSTRFSFIQPLFFGVPLESVLVVIGSAAWVYLTDIVFLMFNSYQPFQKPHKTFLEKLGIVRRNVTTVTQERRLCGVLVVRRMVTQQRLGGTWNVTHHLAIIAWREGARRHSSKDFNLELVTPSVAQPGEIWKIPASIDKKSNLYCNGRSLLTEKYFIYQNRAMQLLCRMISFQARCYTCFTKTRKMV